MVNYSENGGSKAVIIGLSDTDEKVCAAGGRISTQSGSAMEIWEKSQDPQKNASLINKVTKSGHNSTVEHAYFNIAFENVSVMVEQFIIEYRLASFTVKSRRYVDFSEVGYYTPNFEDKALESEYKSHINSLFNIYQQLIDGGIPKEDARFVLPYCFRSNFLCSLNARELLHLLHGMLHGRGSKYPEIYNLGKQLFEQAEKLTPGIMADFNERKPILGDKINLDFLKSDFTSHIKSSSELTELLSYTPDFDKLIAKTALINENQISSESADEIISDSNNFSKIIESVVNCSRPRALENANFTFRINKVSLATITHFSRHRIQSLEIPDLNKSNRNEFIIPNTVKNDDRLLVLYKEAFETNNKLYNKFKAIGIGENILIYILLAGNTLDIILTMNTRELLLFFKLRTCTRAQWEIQAYANDMLKKLRRLSPILFKHFGPGCYTTGRCPEGRLSCGKANEIKEKFSV